MDLNFHWGEPLEKNMGQEDNTEMQIYTPQVYHRSTGCIPRTGETEAGVGAPGKDETLVLLQSLGAVSQCRGVTVSQCLNEVLR